MPQVRLLKLVAANAIVFASFTVIALICWTFGPVLEPVVRPIVKFRHVTTTYRNKEIACFDLPIRKAHEGIPLKYQFFVEAKLSDFIAVSAYIADTHNKPTRTDLVTHRVGEEWTRHYCFDLPGTINDQQDIRVTGEAQHEAHPFWISRTPIQPFIIPAIAEPAIPFK